MKCTKKLLVFMISLILLISNSFIQINVVKAQSKSTLVWEDFESGSGWNYGQGDGTQIEYQSKNNIFGEESKVLKLTTTTSDWPHLGNRSVQIYPHYVEQKDWKNNIVDVSQYKYLSFYALRSSKNNIRLSLIDINNNIVDEEGIFTEDVIPNQWTRINVNISDFVDKGLDLTRIKGIYLGIWDAGTIYFDNIMFTNISNEDLNVTSSIDYNENKVFLKNQFDYDIYYSIDGTNPLLNGTKYENGIDLNNITELKTVCVAEHIVGDIVLHDLSRNEAKNFAPVIGQLFYDDRSFSEVSGSQLSLDKECFEGDYSLKYIVEQSGSPEKDKGSAIVNFNKHVDVSCLKYLIFYIKDTQGSNTMKISLIDANGNESDFGADGWKENKTVKNQWSQYYVLLDDFSGVNKEKISGLRIGQWNKGTYYIDSVYFDNYLSTGLPKSNLYNPISNISSEYHFKDNASLVFNNNANADMYYTLDGSEPSINSNKYSEFVKVESSCTLKIVTYDNGRYSDVMNYTLVKDDDVLDDPKVSVPSGTYMEPIKVTLSANEGDVYYSINGNEFLKYEKPIDIGELTELKILVRKGNSTSNILSYTYNIPGKPSSITTSHKGDVFHSSQKVELISDVFSTIYYTVDGTIPTKESYVYIEPISIDTTTTLKAIAVFGDYTSEIMEKNIKIVPNEIEADKKPGTFIGSTIVEFRVKDTDKVDLYYTTDGSVPTFKSKKYTGPLLVKEDTLFKVRASYFENSALSETYTFEYSIKPVVDLVEPNISPSNGIYGKEQKVEMTCLTSDSNIYYTIDGTEPTISSMKYKNSFMVDKSTTIKAISEKNGKISDVVVRNIEVKEEDTPYLKTDGTVLRDNYGSGKIVQLKGTNAGGWLVMEEWQCPTNAKDQVTMIKTLTERFGYDKAMELIDTYQDNWWTEKDFADLKNEGANVLRLPITYFEMMNTDGSLKQSAFDRLDWFLKNAEKNEMYVLIDMHGAVGSQNGKDHSGDTTIPDKGEFFDNEIYIQQTINLWEEIAKRYKDNPWVCGYDLLNEPGGALGTKQFEVYDRIYDAIRNIDENHIIQIQAIWEPIHLPDPDFYGWENVMYQYHFYGWDNINDFSYQQNFIDSKVKMVNEIADYGIPTFVGEFTFFENIDSWEYGLNVFDKQGWSYTSWTYKVTGLNSSWGMLTNDRNRDVDIYNDSFDEINEKWSKFYFVRNDDIANVLSKHFNVKPNENDNSPASIIGKDATVIKGDKTSIENLLNLKIVDDFDGVIQKGQYTLTTNYDCNTAGVYEVKVSYTDRNNNEAIKIFTITVKDDIDDEQITEKPDEEPVETPDEKPQEDSNDIEIDISTDGTEIDKGNVISESTDSVKTNDSNLVVSCVSFMLLSLFIYCFIKVKKDSIDK